MTDPTGAERPETALRVVAQLSFDNLTWGDLRRFVTMCEHIPDAEPVGLDVSEDATYYPAVGFAERIRLGH